MIPLSKPFLGKEEYRAALDALKSGWLIHGPKNDEFETRFAKYVGVKHAVSLNSCASALQLAVEANRIEGEVIVPSFTHMASANAILRAGAHPVFADIEQKTCMFDPQSVEAAINKKTEAIMVVHFGGATANVDVLLKICKKHKLLLIEDSAENAGGSWKKKKAGSFGTGCFSFFPTKNMTTAEGGMLTTNDSDVARRARIIAGHGVASSFLSREKQKKFWIREAILPGLNFRMSNVQAAIGVEQLKKLDLMNRMRRQRASLLTKLLQPLSGVFLPHHDPRAHHVYQMYTVQVPEKIRDEIVFALRKRGIGASVHFDPPVHLQPQYRSKKFRRVPLPVTESVSKSIITLPMYPGM
ncbi:DegT/DnrJ/EryC1/StrS family aminotransferase, partial [Patescibacteria group bacterium]|nr:DegT/DnrJ/EryC1/StrS family aminotransferase [Patescibacteria group bacterium]